MSWNDGLVFSSFLPFVPSSLTFSLIFLFPPLISPAQISLPPFLPSFLPSSLLSFLFLPSLPFSFFSLSPPFLPFYIFLYFVSLTIFRIKQDWQVEYLREKKGKKIWHFIFLTFFELQRIWNKDFFGLSLNESFNFDFYTCLRVQNIFQLFQVDMCTSMCGMWNLWCGHGPYCLVKPTLVV